MYCWSCGVRSTDEARFCAACGVSLHPTASSTTASGGAGAGEGAGEGGAEDPGDSRKDASRGRPAADSRAGPSSRAHASPALPPPPAVHWTARAPLQLRSCPSCGFRGEGIPYFRRGAHLALLGAATIFTYGIGGLAYWLLKRNDQICPGCGLGWNRSRPLGESLILAAEPDFGGSGDPLVPRSGATLSNVPGGMNPKAPGAVSMSGLPSGGGVRRFGGVILVLLALFLVGMGIVEAELGAVVTGGLLGASGALSFGWGWKAQQRRRQDLLQRMQRQVIRLARQRGGILTATDVAGEMDLSLPAAERVLLSLDDGFRVTSDVTKEGILVFEFRELRRGTVPGELLGPPP